MFVLYYEGGHGYTHLRMTTNRDLPARSMSEYEEHVSFYSLGGTMVSNEKSGADLPPTPSALQVVCNYVPHGMQSSWTASTYKQNFDRSP